MSVNTGRLRAVWLLVCLVVWPLAGQAMSEPPAGDGSSGLARHDYTTRPGAYQLYLQTPQSLGGFWGIGPRPATVEPNSFAVDAHAGVRNYTPRRDCVECHETAARNLHSSRGDVTCRQCHRDEPIAGNFHYYAAMNPIRRHAYICAKCHEGANANYASYVVHEPNPLAAETRESFPSLYYATWFMTILAGGVFVFFVPYVLLWGLRELVARRREAKQGGLPDGNR